MGGSPSLPDDLSKCPDGIRISCNKHAALNYPCDYIAFLDRIVDKKMYAKTLKDLGLLKPTITPHERASDIVMKPPMIMINTGIYSAWVGCQMADEVILTGMDFYQSGTYYHGNGRVRRSNHSKEYFTKCVNQLLEVTVGHKVYAISGPLLDWLDHYKR